MFYCSRIEASQYGDDITNIREGILRQWGAKWEPSLVQPLPYGQYVGMFSDAAQSHLIGLSEYYFYADLEHGFRSSPFHAYADFESLCSLNELAHIRTIYVDEAYRQGLKAYVSLYVYTAQQAMQSGIKYTTLATYQKDVYLGKLYLKMGAQVFCCFDLPSVLDSVAVYSIKLADLIRQPVVARALKRNACEA